MLLSTTNPDFYTIVNRKALLIDKRSVITLKKYFLYNFKKVCDMRADLQKNRLNVLKTISGKTFNRETYALMEVSIYLSYILNEFKQNVLLNAMSLHMIQSFMQKIDLWVERIVVFKLWYKYHCKRIIIY